MNLTEFNEQLQTIRAANSWRLEFEVCGAWIITVRDKITNDFIASTGCTSPVSILIALEELVNNPESRMWNH